MDTLTEKERNDVKFLNLLAETIVIISADCYDEIDEYFECFTETTYFIRQAAIRFERELDYVNNSSQVYYLKKLKEFEDKILLELEQRENNI